MLVQRRGGKGGGAREGEGAGRRRAGGLRHRGSRWVWAPGRCPAGWALRALAGLRLGPQEAQRPAGRGGAGGGGSESQTPLGRTALSSERDPGRPGSPSAAGPGEARGGRAPRPPRPSAHPPGPARTHARTPGMPLGVLEALRAAEPGQAFAGHGAAVFGGVAALAGRSLVAGPSAQVQRAPPGRGAAGWPDRQVRAKGRRSAGLLGRPAAAASVYGHTTLNAPDLV